MLASTSHIPLASNLHQLVPQCVLLLFGFVGVQLPERFGIRLRVGVVRVRNEGVQRVSWRLGSAVHWRHDCGSSVAVDGVTALTGDFDHLRGGAGRGCDWHVAGTQGHAAHSSIDAGALVLATSTEILPILINPPVVLTRSALCLCPADAIGTTHIVAIVALQAFMVVTWPAFVAVLVELSGTHLAAAAAVWDRADPRGTGWGPRWTLAYHRTTSGHQADCDHLRDSKQKQ